MKKIMLATMLVGFGMAGVAGMAQAPAGAPAGAMGICKDGSYSMQAKKEGACRGHKGVQTWYAADASAATAGPAAAKTPRATRGSGAGSAGGSVAAMPTPAAAPAPATATAPAPMAAPASAAPSGAAPLGKRMGPLAAAANKPQAPGGGPGLVWVNTESKVYHCNGDMFYGKTKAGAYMSEADAQAKGAHGVRGKTCGGK